MGFGKRDEENPATDEETENEAERKRLNPDAQQEMEMTKIPVKTKDAGYPEVIVGQDDPLIKAHHLKYLMIGFNFFLTVLGLVLLSLSIWMRVDPEFLEYESTLNVGNFRTVTVMLIIAGLVILFIGFLGCFAAATERRWMLIMYISIFGLIFLLQLAAVIIMWSAPYSKPITRELEKQIQKQVNNREIEESAVYFTDFIQSHLHCCGGISSLDYNGQETPPSCQNPITGNIFEAGCASKMLAYLRSKAGILGGIALPILFIQLLALITAGCLIKSLEVESRYFM